MYAVATALGYMLGFVAAANGVGACVKDPSTIAEPAEYLLELRQCIAAVKDAGGTRADVDTCFARVDARHGMPDAGEVR